MKIFLLILMMSFTGYKSFSQVNLQTGSATFSLPMFNWQDDKSRLNAVVALSYNSGNGLKVNDVASNLGQGWNLIAGGVITRMQVGEPDDQMEKMGGVTDVSKYPAGILYSNKNPEDGCPTALAKYPIYGHKNQLYKQHNLIAEDRELDYFSFSFNGRSGLFVLDRRAFRDNPSVNQGYMLGDTKMKISFTKNEGMIYNGIRTTISSFSIQDENGLIYRFSQHGLTKVLKTNYCDANLIAAQTQPHFDNNKVYHESSFESSEIENPWVINSWSLTEIVDPLINNSAKNKVTFSYVPRNINTLAGTGITYYSESDYSVISHLRTVIQAKEISSINFPDGHQVLINYENEDRIDFPGERAISSVDIKYDNRFVSRFQFNTGYIIKNRFGAPTNEQQRSAARLYLKSVRKTGVDLKESDLPYLFDYYYSTGSGAEDDFVPPANSHLKDIWGFYNGNFSRDHNGTAIPLDRGISELSNNQMIGLCFLRNGVNGVQINPKAGYAKNGLLRQIIYPTGGSLRYDYVQNTGLLNAIQRDVAGVHVSATSLTDGGYSNDCDHPVLTNYKYALENSTASSLWGLELPDNEMVVNNHYAPEYKYWYYKFPFGACSHKFLYPGIQYKEQAFSLTSSQQFMQTVSKILQIVGIVSTVIDVIKLCFVSSGFMAWAAVIMDIIAGLLDIVLTCFTNQSSDTTTHIYYNSDLNASNPLPSQFKRVEVTESSGGNGKTVSEFTSPDDYAIWELSNPAMSMKQRFAYWVYGLPKREVIFSSNGTPLKEMKNEYDASMSQSCPKLIKVFPETFVYSSCKCLTLSSSSQRNVNWEQQSYYDPSPPPNSSYVPESNSALEVDIYKICSGHIELRKSYERVFKPTDVNQYLETVTQYGYSATNYQLSEVITTKSNGETASERTSYSSDNATMAGAVSVMNNNNIVAVPIQKVNEIIKLSGTSQFTKYLGETVTEYVVNANGDIKPSRVLQQRFNSPQDPASMIFYKGPNNPYNPTYFETQSFLYDASGNLTGLKDEGNHIVSNIYDYNDKFVIASVINADPSADKPAYTSFETQNFGGWALSGTAAYSATSVTGNRSFALTASNSLTAPSLNTNKDYKVALWATGGGISVSNSTVLKSEPVINGYRYYEFSIAPGTSSVTITGNAVIDELRIYPASARMRTVTYDPLIGKTSECDENNRVTYYEYDTQGRLRFIKDDKKNVVKMYEYNTVRKQQGCAASYTNLAISETYTKNNCAAGYVGSSSTYTIPAGKYTSTVSQEEVDERVQDELDEYAQGYANLNGSCLLLYYNDALSESFQKENCPLGKIGGSITYTVPANRYTSTISKADANAKARIELNANGWAYVNNNSSVGCTITYDPIWEADESAPTMCQIGSNGLNTGHLLVLMTNVNPYTTPTGQTEWKDAGEDLTACPAGTYACNYENCTGRDRKCVNNTCETGIKVYTGSYYNGYHWECYFHYEFSDGSQSSEYVEIQYGAGGGCIMMVD